MLQRATLLLLANWKNCLSILNLNNTAGIDCQCGTINNFASLSDAIIIQVGAVWLKQ